MPSASLLPARVEPMLATLVDAAPEGDGWLHEIKFDGYRLLARVERGAVHLVTRGGKDWTARFPTLARALAALPATRALLDGEVVVLDEHGVSRFQLLQNALAPSRSARSADVMFFVFDLLHLDGRDLRPESLSARKKLLARLLGRESRRRGPVRYSDHVVGHGPRFHDVACRRGLEGILSKRAASPYVSARTRDWRKVKCQKSQEFVVVGYTAPQGSRAKFGALLLAVNQRVRTRGDERPAVSLRYAGRVGAGFSDASLRAIHARLAGIETRDPPVANPPTGPDARGVRWVKPRLIAQVRFTEWTSDGVLRHPAFLGLREDKAVRDVIRERESKSPRRAPWSGRDRSRVTSPVTPRPSRRARTALAETGLDETPEDRLSAASSAERRAAAPTAKRSSRGRGATSASADAVVLGVRISHPDRVLWPDVGVTKEALARHYARVATKMLPFVRGRPLAIVRCPEGRSGPCFFQKHGTFGMPAAVKTIRVRESSGKEAEYLMVDSAAGLVGLAQISAMEVHVWGARADDPDRPDRAVFDLDPAPGLPWERVVAAAREVRRRLKAEGLESEARSTGGKGLHVVVDASRRRLTWESLKSFARGIAESMAADAPKAYVSKASKAARHGKIFVDWLRNIRGATAIAPYSPRARDGAPVAVPVSWTTLARAKPPFARLLS